LEGTRFAIPKPTLLHGYIAREREEDKRKTRGRLVYNIRDSKSLFGK